MENRVVLQKYSGERHIRLMNTWLLDVINIVGIKVNLVVAHMLPVKFQRWQYPWIFMEQMPCLVHGAPLESSPHKSRPVGNVG